ncbi:MAG: glycosyltransferase [Muribaculaceae bacterium]|nr:glycosyltransferase [Muribaculaceae bacterium]
MNCQPLISVIVPIYNVEKYVGECVDSIINQSYKNLEIILVDDGSTDRSGEICDDYAQRDNRIKVIHRENGGLSEARNTGLDATRGEYTTFVDSDDLIHQECISTLYNLLVNTQTDISTVSFNHFADGEQVSTKAPLSPVKVYNTGEDAVKSMLYQQGYIDNSPCGKLFKTGLFSSHRFPKGKLYEDLATIPYVCLKAKKVATTTTPMYHYRSRSSSILGRFSLRRCDVLDITRDLVRYMEQNHLSIVNAARSRQFSANMNILWLMSATEIKDDAVEARCWENIKTLRLFSLVNPRVRMKNKIGAIISFIGLKNTMKILKCFKNKLSH